MTKKVGLVIQGPTLSKGGWGPKYTYAEFDSSKNIEVQYALARELGFEVIVSTWKSNSLQNLLNIPPNDIIQSDDYIIPYKNNIKNIASPGRNKYNQFYSTLVGSCQLQDRGCTIIVKTRTDQLVQLRKLSEYLLKVDSDYLSNRVLVPYFDPEQPNYAEDFYLVAETPTMIRLCNTFLHSKEIYINTHRDFFYKWLRINLNKSKVRPLVLNFFPRKPSYSEKQFEIILTGWRELFGPLPLEMHKELIWRGTNYSEFSQWDETNVFFSETQDLDFEKLIQEKVKIEGSALKFQLFESVTWLINSRFENFLRMLFGKVGLEIKKLRSRF